LIAAIRAVAEGREHGVESPPVLHEAPTAREIQVLRLVQEGLKNRAIAERLQTSERTVQFHLTNVFAKLNAASHTEAVHLARKYGWLD
jgi:DNA-binding NarL/FixJ family response regulator